MHESGRAVLLSTQTDDCAVSRQFEIGDHLFQRLHSFNESPLATTRLTPSAPQNQNQFSLRKSVTEVCHLVFLTCSLNFTGNLVDYGSALLSIDNKI
jgi:hypothetical protein